MTGRIAEITTGPAGVTIQVQVRIGHEIRDYGKLLDPLTPAQARGWAKQLLAAADRQESETLERLHSQRAYHRAQLNALSRQLDEIEVALAGAAWSPIVGDDIKTIERLRGVTA